MCDEDPCDLMSHRLIIKNRYSSTALRHATHQIIFFQKKTIFATHKECVHEEGKSR